KYYSGVYSSASGWDDATTSAEPTGDAASAVPGKTAPSLASAGTSLVFGFCGSDGSLDRETKGSTTWGAATAITGASTDGSPRTLIAFDAGGAHDLMTVYIGSDFFMHSTTRTASNKAWSPPILANAAAQPGGRISLAPMTNGRAMALFTGTNAKPYWML